MPRVPLYEQQVTESPLPSARQSVAVTPQAFGAVQGENMQRLGGVLQQRAEQIQQREDQDLVNRALVTFEDEQRRFLNDAEQGVLNQKGGLAIGATTRAAEWFEKNQPRYAEGLKTDRQRQLFQQQYERSRLSAMQVVSRFESQERRQSFVDSAQARAASAIENASLYYSQPDVVARAKEDMQSAVEAVAAELGWTPEMKQAAMLEKSSTFHKRQIEARLEKDPTAAREYFKANKSEILAADRQAIEDRIEVGALRGGAQHHSDVIMSSGLSEAQALERARAIKDPEMRDEVVRRVTQRYAEQRRILQQDQSDAMQEAYNLWLGGTSVADMPDALYMRLAPESKRALMELEVKEGKVVTDTATWVMLQKMATDPQTRAQFAELNLLDYSDKLEQKDIEHFSKLQGDLRKGDTQDINTLATKESMVDAAILRLGLDPADDNKKDGDGEKILKFRELAEREYQDYQRANGKKPDNATLKTMLDRLTIQIVRDDRMFWNRTVPQYEISQAELGPVPQVWLDELAAALVADGKEPNITNIKSLYEELQRAGAMQ